MRIENELKLDFSDVLIRPKRSTLFLTFRGGMCGWLHRRDAGSRSGLGLRSASQ